MDRPAPSTATWSNANGCPIWKRRGADTSALVGNLRSPSEFVEFCVGLRKSSRFLKLLRFAAANLLRAFEQLLDCTVSLLRLLRCRRRFRSRRLRWLFCSSPAGARSRPAAQSVARIDRVPGAAVRGRECAFYRRDRKRSRPFRETGCGQHCQSRRRDRCRPCSATGR